MCSILLVSFAEKRNMEEFYRNKILIEKKIICSPLEAQNYWNFYEISWNALFHMNHEEFLVFSSENYLLSLTSCGSSYYSF
jgi:hypothetical protein